VTAAVPRPRADGRERILVVGSPYVGDTVIAVPFLRNLRQAFPDHAIDLLAEGRIPAELLHACPHLDAILPWERPAKRRLAAAPAEVRGRGTLAALANALACGAALRSRHYTRAYLLKRSPSAALLALRAGIPHRIGHASSLVRPLLTRAVPVVPGRHRIDSWLDLLSSEGRPVDDGRLELPCDAASIAHVDRLLATLPAGRPRVFLAVTASNWRRQWPLDRWAAVVRLLVAERGCEIVLCGSEADRAVHTVVREAAPGHVHDLSAAVPIRELSALMSRTDLFLGVESGLMHVAAACGMPTVTLFDPRTEPEWRARGSGHVTISAAPDQDVRSGRRERAIAADATWLAGRALAAIPVTAVLDRVRAALATRPTMRTLDLRTDRVAAPRVMVVERRLAPSRAQTPEPLPE
jgi:ADP-heptose:LPS heptosyltransferase